MGKAEVAAKKPSGRIDWDAFREAYPDMSFAELEVAMDRIDKQHPIQRHCHTESLLEMFGMLPSDLEVVELGCHDGYITNMVLQQYERKVRFWKGYDFKRILARSIPTSEKYEPVPLTNFFHLMPLEPFNVFVCSHTIEHLTDEQFMLTMIRVKEHAKWVFLEAPIAEFGQDWKGYRGSHVMTYGYRHVHTSMEALGYRTFYERPRYGVSGWEKK